MASEALPRANSQTTAPNQALTPGISLPKGGGALRSVDDKFEVQAATGSLSFGIAIQAPDGRQGFEPQLSLGYDSGSGNGPFGLGWTLSPPVISRRTDRGIPRYGDDDTFLLSGHEDLVPVLSQGEDGEWRPVAFEREAAGASYSVERFRPRVEAAFLRIERWTRIASDEVHWRSVSADNVTAIYGLHETSRISDPADPTRVFSWLLCQSFDDRGNAIAYEYKAEDNVSVLSSLPQERNRLRTGSAFANRYLKRIRYGNRTPRTEEEDLAVRDDWMFQVVFDYGEHDELTPAPDEVRPWPVRADSFSTFRPGFDLRTYRLCRRVLVFHSFSELGEQPCLVHSMDFRYDERGTLSLLVAVTATGYIRNTEDGSYEVIEPVTGAHLSPLATPPMEFGYTQAVIDETVNSLDGASLEQAPLGFEPGRYSLLDLDAEGVGGILADQQDAWYFKDNLGHSLRSYDPGASVHPPLPTTHLAVGPVDFAAGRSVTPHASLLNLSNCIHQLLDLGAGSSDLVILGEAFCGYYAREDGDWRPFRNFDQIPAIDWRDPNLRLIDLSGDGRADVLISEDTAFTWYPSLGRRGFGEAQSIPKADDEESGPAVVFADPAGSVVVADMNGDGLPDIVRITNQDVCYWPNRGYGHFGAKVSMNNAPVLDAPDSFDPERLLLVDIDGTGPADIIYLARNGPVLYFNQAGNGWSDGRRIDGFPGVDNASQVTVADIEGSGTACLVWSTPLPGASDRPLRYVDLMGGGKPHLLNRIVNNVGAETRLQYAPATRFYLEDKLAGRPWITKPPFPVQVVEQVDVRELVTASKLVSHYRYHHGFFDGEEREFHGFGLVERWDTEAFERFSGAGLFPDATVNAEASFHQPPVYEKTWFHTGAYLKGQEISRHFAQEYYQGDPEARLLADTLLPPLLTAIEEKEAVRALKGKTLRTEVFSVDGEAASAHPYAVRELSYSLRQMQPRNNDRPSAYLAFEREQLSYEYERRPEDPRISHVITLEVDDFGNSVRLASLAYPRRHAAIPEQATSLATLTESDVVNQAEGQRVYRLGTPSDTRVFEISGLDVLGSFPFAFDDVSAAVLAAAEIPYEAEATPGQVQRRLIERSRQLYYADDLSGPLPLGLAGARALPFETQALAFTPGLLEEVFGSRVSEDILSAEGGYSQSDGLWWIPSGRQVFDPQRFFLATQTIDPFAQVHLVDYDRDALFVVSTEDPLHNIVRAEIDYRALQPWLVTDANGNQTAVRFDALNMVTATAVMGSDGSGDTLDDPSSRSEYSLFEWIQKRRPNFARTLARELHGAANIRWQESFAYSDGSGRVIESKLRVEPGPAPLRDAQGNLVMSSDEVVLAHAQSRWVGSGRVVFDNKGNSVRQFEPYFSATHEFENQVWGVSPILRYDPLGRMIRTDYPDGTLDRVEFDPWSQRNWDRNDTVLESDWFAERQSLPSNHPERRAAGLSAAHANTPSLEHLDVLGRVVVAVADNGDSGQFLTRTTIDIEGNALAIVDARGVLTEVNRFDVRGRVLRTWLADAGERLTLSNAANNRIRAWDSRGHAFQTLYDPAQRPTAQLVQSGVDEAMLVERLVYGEALLESADLNLRGELYRHYDGAGVATNEAFDFKGNLLRSSRRLGREYRQSLDWSILAGIDDPDALAVAADALLETNTFIMSNEYDALDRVIQATMPDGSVTLPVYDAAGALASLSVRLRGAAEAMPFVQSIEYDARGERSRVQFANGSSTTYSYNPRSLGLMSLVTRRGTEVLQDLRYTYDAAGHIVDLRDEAQESLIFDNALVLPGASYEYDALYRLSSATGREHPGQTPSAQRGPDDVPTLPLPHPNDANGLRAYTERYEYDAAGNLLRLTHTSAGGQWSQRYAYEPDSSHLQATSLPGDAPQGTFSATYEYDQHGNVTRMPHLPVMRWDYRDQLSSSARQVVNEGVPETTYYVYDAGSQRVRKVTERHAAAGTQPTRTREHVYFDGFEVLREYGGDGDTVSAERETLHVMDGAERIALVETETRRDDAEAANVVPRRRYQLGNHLASTLLELDENGLIFSYEEYHPFGTTAYHSVRSGVEVSSRRHRFTGKERDEETGFYYMGARYYAPWLGRWTAPDPMGLEDGPALYAYASDNPISAGDPSGTSTAPPQESEQAIYARKQAEMSDAAQADFIEPFLSVWDPAVEVREIRVHAPPTPTTWEEVRAFIDKTWADDSLSESDRLQIIQTVSDWALERRFELQPGDMSRFRVPSRDEGPVAYASSPEEHAASYRAELERQQQVENSKHELASISAFPIKIAAEIALGLGSLGKRAVSYSFARRAAPQKIKYGRGISGTAVRYRARSEAGRLKAAGSTGPGNVVVAEIPLREGVILRKAVENIPAKGKVAGIHAEVVMKAKLAAAKIDPARVARLYSDYRYCQTKCLPMVLSEFPKAKLFYSTFYARPLRLMNHQRLLMRARVREYVKP